MFERVVKMRREMLELQEILTGFNVPETHFGNLALQISGSLSSASPQSSTHVSSSSSPLEVNIQSGSTSSGAALPSGSNNGATFLVARADLKLIGFPNFSSATDLESSPFDSPRQPVNKRSTYMPQKVTKVVKNLVNKHDAATEGMHAAVRDSQALVTEAKKEIGDMKGNLGRLEAIVPAQAQQLSAQAHQIAAQSEHNKQLLAHIDRQQRFMLYLEQKTNEIARTVYCLEKPDNVQMPSTVKSQPHKYRWQ
ncbi:hypothetical protein BGZ54_001666 [Gamsiella multidivaricata]|nr:hypothetical protein BGZ54_001666 [Gamsiella multidivaricata]